MYKKISMLFLVLVVIIGSNVVYGQKQYDKIKDRIQEQLNISEAKADTVAGIVQNFLTRSKTLKANTSMTDDNRRMAIKAERKRQVARLRTLLTEDQMHKLQDMIQDYKAHRQSNKDNADTSLKKYYF